MIVRCVAALAACLIFGPGALLYVGTQDDLGKADVALVLGSKVETDGQPSARLRSRLEETAELYRAGWFPLIVTSGGVGKEGFDEAVVMKDFLVSKGIPADRIITDSTGVTTYASALQMARIARERHFQSVLVVSQAFHIPRARLALRRFGIPTVYSAHSRYFEMRDLYSAPRELFGYASYLFRRYEIGDAK